MAPLAEPAFCAPDHWLDTVDGGSDSVDALPPDVALETADAVEPGTDDQAPSTTRVIGPPEVVQPFAGAAPSAPEPTTPPQVIQPELPERLPPGPPNRLP
jgi:hypothetical protein